MIIVDDIKQQTDEWFELKKGKMGASHASTIMANGKGLKTYTLELITDFYAKGERISYTNADMERGNELEPEARDFYSELFTPVREVGAIIHDDYTVISPDGINDDDNGIISGVEIKCPRPKTFIYAVLNDYIDPKYYAQCQISNYVTGADYWDYFIYCPENPPHYYHKRIMPDEQDFDKIKKGLQSGKEQLIDLHNRMEKILND